VAIEGYGDVNQDNSTDAYWKTIIAGATSTNEVGEEYGRYFSDWYETNRS
jgi:hypothetical protein